MIHIYVFVFFCLLLLKADRVKLCILLLIFNGVTCSPFYLPMHVLRDYHDLTARWRQITHTIRPQRHTKPLLLSIKYLPTILEAEKLSMLSNTVCVWMHERVCRTMRLGEDLLSGGWR